jgi:sterol desaturase/sphingolipid hydroxylase (fatty acid hydroxylase superfamily)
MMDPFLFISGWLQEHLVIPVLWQIGLIEYDEISFSWTQFAVYGVSQVLLTFALCWPLERWWPVERWSSRRAVRVDVLYTFIARIGLFPLLSNFTAWLTDQGWTPPTLEGLFPWLMGKPAVTFIIYMLTLDFADYWRHRLSHRLYWWWPLHSLHHAQRQMTFWSDARNHLLDDLITLTWFGLIGIMIGLPPLQFPLVVLSLGFVQSLSHVNAKISFGWLGERILVSPRFHRAHHGILAAGQRSCNYGSVFTFWDQLFGTADFNRLYAPTGDPSAHEKLATGNYLEQQWAGLRRFASTLVRA